MFINIWCTRSWTETSVHHQWEGSRISAQVFQDNRPASGHLVFRKQRASWVPRTVPNPSKWITGIKYRVLFRWGTERLRTFSVKPQGWCYTWCTPSNFFHLRAGRSGCLLTSDFPYFIHKLRLCDEVTFWKEIKPQDRHCWSLWSSFPKMLFVWK